MPIVYDAFGKAYADNGPYKNTNKPQAPPGARPVTNTPVDRPVPIKAVTREQFGTPSREGIDQTQADLTRFRAEVDNPRGTARFGELLGQASSGLARAAAERTRQAQEIAGRRGYVGGYDAVSEMAQREADQGRARIGFDAASTIARDALGMYDSAAGRYANLVSAYNELLGAGDRAYAGALEDTYARRAAAVESFRQQQEQQRQYDTTLAEDRRQYDTGLGEKQREFDVTTGEGKRQFDTSTAEGKRQFDAQQALDQKKLDAAIRDNDLDRAVALAKDLGIDPRLILGRFGLSGPGSGRVPGVIGRPGAVTTTGPRPNVFGTSGIR